MILISTQTASSSASLSWTGLGSTYNTLFLDCNGMVPATTNNTLELQVGEGATPTWETASYVFESASINELGGGNGGAGTIFYYDSNSGANIALTYANDIETTAGDSAASKIWISNVSSTSLYKNVQFISAWQNSTSTQRTAYGSGSYQGDKNAITAVRVLMASGNISSGQCSLYGLNH